MKYLIIFIGLMSVNISHAQTETETKRPSWSQGLPERQSANQPGNPSFKPEADNSTIATPNTSGNRPTTPVIDIDIVTQPDLNFNIESKAPQSPETQSVRRPGFSRYHNREVSSKEVNPLHAKYHWTTIKTAPIDIPARYATKDTLKVRIYINPKGEVIKVAAGAPDVPALMLKQA